MDSEKTPLIRLETLTNNLRYAEYEGPDAKWYYIKRIYTSLGYRWVVMRGEGYILKPDNGPPFHAADDVLGFVSVIDAINAIDEYAERMITR